MTSTRNLSILSRGSDGRRSLLSRGSDEVAATIVMLQDSSELTDLASSGGSSQETPYGEGECEYTQVAVNAAIRAVEKMSEDSLIIKSGDIDDSVAKFRPEEVVWGALLGRGGFSDVHEIIELRINKPLSQSLLRIPESQEKSSSELLSLGEDSDLKSLPLDERVALCDIEKNIRCTELRRQFVATHLRRGAGDHENDARYAIKFLSHEVMKDSEMYQVGASDLAREARFLASFEHPSIVKIRAISSEGEEGFRRKDLGGYFIIMDRLYETLLDRVREKWCPELKAITGRSMIKDLNGEKRKKILDQRLTVMVDFAGALEYLHDNLVLHRDLKSENLAFDVRGDIKLYDFGLAKELIPELRLRDDQYKLTGGTGTLRYMAPEVNLNEPYGRAADVYGFGMILYEVMALKQPFEKIKNRREFESEVIYGKSRPQIKSAWPKQISGLMQSCWSFNPNERPDMATARKIIQHELKILRGEEIDEGRHRRRRSTHLIDLSSPLLSRMSITRLGLDSEHRFRKKDNTIPSIH
eukprot:scaffold421227_cov54-Attheya_sp.AAC.1